MKCSAWNATMKIATFVPLKDRFGRRDRVFVESEARQRHRLVAVRRRGLRHPAIRVEHCVTSPDGIPEGARCRGVARTIGRMEPRRDPLPRPSV